MLLNNPLVSIIIPTYNRSDFLVHAVNSVLSQTFEDFELLIIDDGSIDDTQTKIKEFNDIRIRYIYQMNAGLAAARNTGIKQSRGKYIAFLDDDDLWLRDKLAHQIQSFRNYPKIDLLTCGYQVIDSQGNVLDEIQPWIWRPQLNLRTWLTSCPTVPSAVIIRREWLDIAGNFDERISRRKYGAEDWDLWIRLAYIDCQMAWVKEILCAYRIHETSMSHNAQRQRLGMLFALDKLFDRTDLQIEIKEDKNQIYSLAYLRTAARLYIEGQAELAKADLEKAFHLNPGLLKNNGEELFQGLVGWAGNPIVRNAENYLEYVFDNLPCEMANLTRRKREAFGIAAKGDFFKSYQRKNWKVVQQSLVKMVINQPSFILDKGIISVTMEMIIGSKMISKLKKLLPA